MNLFRCLLLGSVILFGVSARAEPTDAFAGTFHFDTEPKENTHKFWKQDGKYLYASCFGGKCSPNTQPARLLTEAEVSEWFLPSPRWKDIGSQGITVDGSGIILFFVARPDERIKGWTQTNYVFRFWVIQGSAERVD